MESSQLVNSAFEGVPFPFLLHIEPSIRQSNNHPDSQPPVLPRCVSSRGFHPRLFPALGEGSLTNQG